MKRRALPLVGLLVGLATPVATLAVAAVAGCHRPRPGDGPSATASAAERRTLLLRPDDPFWRVQAPDTVRTRVETSRGAFVLETYRAWAPIGVDRFYNLVRAGYFDDARFHRVVPGYIVQWGIAGDPAVTAVWNARPLADDPPRESNTRGTFAFAMRGPNDRRTQLYVNLADNRRNDRDGFAILGRVVEGMAVVDALYAGYGERSGGGMRAGRQQRVLAEGNAYLDRDFPTLDRLVRAQVVYASRARGSRGRR
jgi:cyclophilin family peptidyl-prolyl cis-trans isomerase